MIDEIATSVGDDPSQQYVEIRMLANLQSFVSKGVLGAFDADGKYLGDVLVVPTNVSNAGAGVRWIMATQAFQDAHGFAADFTIPAGVLSVQDGMVCWGAPGIAPPDPATWDHTDPTSYVDCVAYGRFCGTSPGGPPVAASPAEHSLVRTATTRFSNRDFACSTTLSPRNNAGIELSLAGAPCAQVPATLCGIQRPGAGGGTNCLAVWVVKAAVGAIPVVSCPDGDPSCDDGNAPGCSVRVQLCFEPPGLFPKCAAGPVTEFALRGKTNDDVARGNAKQVTDALVALGGQVSGANVTFAPPLAAGECTAAFHLSVPLGARGGKPRKGVRTLRSITRAGRKVGHDRLKLVCVP